MCGLALGLETRRVEHAQGCRQSARPLGMANSTRRAASAWSSSRKLPVGESARAHAATHGIVENQSRHGPRNGGAHDARSADAGRVGSARRRSRNWQRSLADRSMWPPERFIAKKINAKFGRQLGELTVAS